MQFIDNLCKISYKFQRVAKTGFGMTSSGVADPGAVPPTTAPLNTYAWTGDIAATPAKIGPITAKSADSITEGGADAQGDWGGEFTTHDKVPRVVSETFNALSTVAGGSAQGGNGTTAHGNSDYYENRNGSGSDHTTQTTITTQFTRQNLLPL